MKTRVWLGPRVIGEAEMVDGKLVCTISDSEQQKRLEAAQIVGLSVKLEVEA